VLEAPLKFEPDGTTCRFSAPVATGKLIADAVLPAVVVSASDSWQEPTKVAFPSIPSWNQIATFLQSMQRLRDSVGFVA
jgi:hypothetical protein